uniref:Putative shugoshin-1 n=1 Tax=Davidia involucrata TaxID=16924 RepID=A0A5B7BEL4_DAVIN
MRGERMAKRSSFGSIVRKKLSDITNSLPQPKSPIHDEKLLPTASSAKEYIDHLLKENMALMKIIEDKNKIIELSGTELQKMRINLQKLQLQNWNFAQSNSHILAELNLGKEKLKALKHEIICKDALLKAKNLELEGQAKVNNPKNCSQEGEEAVGEHKSDDENKPHNGGHKRRSTRSKSMGPLTTTFQQAEEKETVENKRRRLRRQSASLQQEPTENLFEIEDAKFPVAQPQESQRTSIGRPLRKAAERVQSYKEIPLNIKMRRPE